MVIFVFAVLAMTRLVHVSRAEPRPLRAGTNAPPLTASVTNAPLREVEPGVFQLGGVRLDKARRALSFPAEVNMTAGPVEYLIVHRTGKVHESVLRTEVEPYHIHLAALLLQPRPFPVNTNEGLAARVITGPAARITARWSADGASHEAPGEAWVFNVQTRSAMAAGDWTHNGSRVIGGTFLAQRDGSIASVITDPDALLNGMRPGRDRDDLWEVNTRAVPPLNTPVQVTIEFAREPARAQGSADAKLN